MTGEPKVSTEVYKKYCLMRLVEIPIRRPIAVQTPNTFHSTKDFSFSIGEGFGFYLFKNTKDRSSLGLIFLILHRENKIENHGI